MSKLRKSAMSAIITLAGAAGLLVVAAPVAVLGQGDAAHENVSVLADSPWDRPKP